MRPPVRWLAAMPKPLTTAHRGAEGCSRVTCGVVLRVSPEGKTLAPV